MVRVVAYGAGFAEFALIVQLRGRGDCNIELEGEGFKPLCNFTYMLLACLV